MTASVFVSPSAVKLPVTLKLLSLAVVINTLSALTTYITGVLSFVISAPSSTICTLSSSPASTFTVKLLALPLITYTPASVISAVLLSSAVMLTASSVSAVCSRSRSVNISPVSSTESSLDATLSLPSLSFTLSVIVCSESVVLSLLPNVYVTDDDELPSEETVLLPKVVSEQPASIIVTAMVAAVKDKYLLFFIVYPALSLAVVFIIASLT